MKLSVREDIEAPSAGVYAAASDFAAFERQFERRGVTLTRVAGTPEAGPGMCWKARFDWRGRPYDLDATLVSQDEGVGYAIESASAGIVCMTVVDLVPLSKTRTRMLVSLEMRPTTLSSRLLIQSLKLAKGRLSARLGARVAEFARRMES